METGDYISDGTISILGGTFDVESFESDGIQASGNVTVFYTPDGGEKTEIYKADAESLLNN